MNRALFEYEPLIVFITFYCFLVFNFEFYFLRGTYCTKFAPLCAVGATLLQCAIDCWQPSGKFVTGVRGCWQPSGKFVIGCQRLLATL
jgi:hypothetical protein